MEFDVEKLKEWCRDQVTHLSIASARRMEPLDMYELGQVQAYTTVMQKIDAMQKVDAIRKGET